MTHGLLSMCRSDAARSCTTVYIRSFLRYLQWASFNPRDLSLFVPRTPGWRHVHLPPRLAWKDVRRAIDAIETSTPSGVRDRAMMLLFATTGLRNRESRELELGDIRWRTGELMLRHTKGHRDRVVPLLQEVGAALAKYVLHGRPATPERRVFLSLVTPVRPFSRSSTVSRIVRIRLARAGVMVQRAAHLLRHSLAMILLQSGVDLLKIQAWLGHAQVATTHRYAAADAEMMRRGLDKAHIRGSPTARFRPKDAAHCLLENL